MKIPFRALAPLLALSCSAVRGEIRTLAPAWDFALAAPNVDLTSLDTRQLDFHQKVLLPGTMDENALGNPTATQPVQTGHLSRERTFAGVAFYRQDIEIPTDWAHRRVTLLLERTRKSRLWLDHRLVGQEVRATSPHAYDLGADVAPGKHTLLISVDNRPAGWPPGLSHMTSEDTQTNWNGLLGKLQLESTPKVWISQLRVTSDVPGKRVKFQFHLNNITGSTQPSQLRIRVSGANTTQGVNLPELQMPLECPKEGCDREVTFSLGENPLRWDEFAPEFYHAQVNLTLDAGAEQQLSRDFGLCDFKADGTQMLVNGRRIFLRGKHDACVFPLTGYAPMTVPEWVAVFRQARNYGINHYRFHTWCPPEAAFAAADQVGIYLQPEFPCWGALAAAERNVAIVDPNAVAFGVEKAKAQRIYDPAVPTAAELFYIDEGKAIIDAYGDHPSFRMFSLGNEMSGNRVVMGRIVDTLRAYDQARRLYAQGSNNHFNDPQPGPTDDYFTTVRTSAQTWNKLDNTVRASFAFVDQELGGSINKDRPSTQRNYARALAGIKLPVIGHETGQYQYYPDYQELARYTGVLKPRNLQAAQALLEKQGMMPQARDFFRAAGIFASILYGEDMESQIRTPGLAGFQLLDLQDFPGQGTSLVGPLNAFMESKGLVTPETWRQSCDQVVVLAEFADYVQVSGGHFKAQLKVANYSSRALVDAKLHWQLDAIGSGTLSGLEIPQGGIARVGELDVALPEVPRGQKLTLSLRLNPYFKEYPLWLFPRQLPAKTPANVLLRQRLDASCRQELAEGKRVFLQLPAAEIESWSLPGLFNTEFWSYSMFSAIARGQKKEPAAGTMGLLIQETHPALAGFPTEFHSNWQWWSVSRHSRPMIFDDAPANYRPIIQSIDNLWRSHKLALLAEFSVGPGTLVISSIDFPAIDEYPEGRALYRSILEYMAGEDFKPRTELDLKGSLAQRLMGEK